MAPTREIDRHGTPILISDSPPHSPRSKRDSAPRRGITKLPPRPPPLQEQSLISGRMAEWVNNLQPVNRPPGVSGLGANSVNFAGHPLPSIPGLTYGLDLPPAPQPIPNITKMVVGDYGRPLQSRWGPQISDPKHDFAPAPIIEKLPFNIEHSILCAMQRLMEESLFYWAKKWVPALLDREGWETPEAGELNRWLGAIQKWIIPHDAFNLSSGMTLHKIRTILRDKLHYIRHAAVHRNPTSVSSLKRMLADAQLLTNGLRDVPRGNKLRAMALALEFHDVKAIEAIITAPVLTFSNAVSFQNFQTQTGHVGSEAQQKENVDPFETQRSGGCEEKKKVCSPRPKIGSRQCSEDTRSSNKQPAIGDTVQLGRQSSDSFPPATNQKNGPGTPSDVPIRSIEGEECAAHEKDASVQTGPRNINSTKRSETIKLEAANHQPRIIKYPIDTIDLTMDSDDENPSAAVPVPAKSNGFIDLTGDEPIVLFRSARAI